MVESIIVGSFVSDTCDFPLLRKGVGRAGGAVHPPGLLLLLAVTGPLVYAFKVRMARRGPE